MKTGLGIVCLAGWLTSAAFGGVLVYQDGFNDGKRNAALWTFDNYFHGRFAETNGRLYGYSGTAAPSNDYHAVTWKQIPAVKLINHDVLEVEAVLRLPMLAISSAPNAYIGMEIGLTIPNSIPLQSVYFWFTRTSLLGRNFNLDVAKPNRTTDGWGFDPPGNAAKYYIKLRYNTTSGFLTLLYKTSPEQNWTALKTIDLNGEWNMAPGSPVTLQAYLEFGTSKTRVDEPEYVYFDNFKLTRTRP